jgi:hypothetical protein
MKLDRRSVVRVAVGVALVLTVPLVAMQFTDEVVWTLGDFVVVGALLAVIGIAIELAVKGAGSRTIAVGVVAVGLLSGVWGMDGDAPGLVVLGLVLVVSGLALGMRAARTAR